MHCSTKYCSSNSRLQKNRWKVLTSLRQERKERSGTVLQVTYYKLHCLAISSQGPTASEGLPICLRFLFLQWHSHLLLPPSHMVWFPDTVELEALPTSPFCLLIPWYSNNGWRDAFHLSSQGSESSTWVPVASVIMWLHYEKELNSIPFSWRTAEVDFNISLYRAASEKTHFCTA